jgi:hypothetical protein
MICHYEVSGDEALHLQSRIAVLSDVNRTIALMRAKGRTLAPTARGVMDNFPNGRELTHDEMTALRLIVRRSFMSRKLFAETLRNRLVELGLIQIVMGGVSPTPAGRIAAR